MSENVFFKHVVLTNKSREFITKIITANKQMQFTKAEVGDGQVTDDNLQDLNSLVNCRKEAEIVSVRRDGTEAIVDIKLNSENVTEGFALREIGLYAQMDDEEILYAYLNAGDKYDFVTPTINGQAFSQNIQLVISVGDASNVEVVFNDLNITDGSITINMLDDSLKDKINSIDTHGSQTIIDADGVHGLKYDATQRKFKYFTDASQWEDVTLSNIVNNNVDEHITKKICDDGGVHGIEFAEEDDLLMITKRNGQVANYKAGVDPDLLLNDLNTGLDNCIEKVGRTNG